MQTMTMRTLAELAYDRGVEYDAALIQPSPDLVDALSAAGHAGRPLEAPSTYERRRRREQERRTRVAYVPDWFDAADLDHGPVGIHGEPI